MFSIVIPTWNNLAYLQLCVKSINENSNFNHQIIVHVNDGRDGTLGWVKEQRLDFTHSSDNVGICSAVNWAAALAKNDYIVYMNDDMVCAPNWDAALVKKINYFGTDLFMLSGTMIQPLDTNNDCTIVANYGLDAASFNLQKFNETAQSHKKDDWSGSTWPPTVVHKKWWQAVGGYSIEFSPGMSSDNDFAMKMWHVGCRIYIGAGDSLIYHFMQKSTGKIIKNNGGKQFLRKWGITASTFDRFYSQLGFSKNQLQMNSRSTAAYKYHLIRSKIKNLLPL